MTCKMSLARFRMDQQVLPPEARDQRAASKRVRRTSFRTRSACRCVIRSGTDDRPLAFIGRAPSGAGDGHRIATKHGRFTKGIAKQDMGRRTDPPAFARRPVRARQLELSRRSDRVHVGAGIDHCALASEISCRPTGRPSLLVTLIGAIDRHGMSIGSIAALHRSQR